MRWLLPKQLKYSALLNKADSIYSPSADSVRDENENSALYEKQQRRKSYTISLIFSVFLNAFFSLLLLLGWLSIRSSRHIPLLPSPVPDFPPEIRTFRLDPLYLSLPTDESNTAWEALPGPNGRGFINIDPGLGLDLPDKKAGLSVFHQLHCLGALRRFTWALLYDKVDRTALLNTWPANVSNPTYEEAINGLWHYAHCFDYLRQGIQCSGDTSLEFVSEETGNAVVDGLVYPHVCKNWDMLWAFAKTYG